MPGEIQNIVYSYVLENTVLLHPKNGVTVASGLAGTSRQVHAELLSLAEEKLPSKVMVRNADFSQLRAHHAAVIASPLLRKAPMKDRDVVSPVIFLEITTPATPSLTAIESWLDWARLTYWNSVRYEADAESLLPWLAEVDVELQLAAGVADQTQRFVRAEMILLEMMAPTWSRAISREGRANGRAWSMEMTMRRLQLVKEKKQLGQ